MGIFDIFRGKDKPPEEDERIYSISLESMPVWIKEHFEDETETAKINARRIGTDAIESLSNTKERLLRLEKANFGDKDKSFAAANMAKNSFVKRSLSIIDGLRYSGPGKDTYSGLLEFNARLSDALTDINKTSPKQLFLLSRYFKNDSRLFMDSLKHLKEKSGQISVFLETEGRIISMSEKLEMHIMRLNELLSKSEKLKSQQNEIEDDISSLEQVRKSSKSALEMLLSGREWKELSKTEQSLGEARQGLEELEDKANETLSSAKRPLKKLRHLLESREAFPDNPFKDIILAGREVWLISMLDSAKKHAEDGSIALKPRESDRLDNIRKWIEIDMPKTRARYNQLAERIEDFRRSLSRLNIKGRKAEMENRLSETDFRLKKRWQELDTKIKETKHTESEIEELKRRTEKLVLDFGKKRLTIKMPVKHKEHQANNI